MPSGVKIGVGVEDNASNTVDRIRDRFDKLGASGGVKSFTEGLGMGAGIGVFNLATQAISGVATAMGEMVQGAIADEESQNRLKASLKANIPGWDGNTDAIEKNILAKQRLGFDDETLRDSLTVLAGATGDVTKAQQIQNTAMDLARYKGIDLRTASEALIKVQGGQYRALAQLGIKLRDGVTSTEALAAVQKVAAGQGEAYAQSTKGQMDAIGIAMAEVGESIGQALMPVLEALLPIIKDKIVPAIQVFAGFLGVLLEAAAPVIGFIADVAVRVFETFADMILTAGEAILTVASAIPGPWQDGAKSMLAGVQEMKAGLKDLTGEAVATAEDVGPEVGGALADGAGAVGAGAEEGFTPIPEEADKAGEQAATSMASWLTTMVDDIRASENEFVGAWKAVLDASYAEQENGNAIAKNLADQRTQEAILADKKATKAAKAEAAERLADLQKSHAELLAEQSTYGSTAEQITKTSALLQSKAMVDGLKSSDEDVRNYWLALRGVTLDRLTTLMEETGEMGAETGQAYGRGIGGKRARGSIREGVDNIEDTVRTNVRDNIKEPAEGWGENATRTFAHGMGNKSSLAEVGQAVERVAGLVRTYLQGFSPPRQGPLHFIDVWGENVGKAWSDGLAKGAKNIKVDVLQGIRSSLGGVVARPALPAGLVERRADTFNPGGSTDTTYGSGAVINLTVNLNGPTFDPYSDFAQRLAATLIPGLQRELARQGLNL